MSKFSLSNRNRDPFGFIDPFFDDFFHFPFEIEKTSPSAMMKTDIEDKGDHFLLTMDLPSIDRKDITMNLENGYLTIRATRQENDDKKDKQGNFIRRERFYGTYERSFYVGDQIQQKDVSAKLDQGTLTIEVKKEQEVVEDKKKYIEIQ